MVLAVGFGYSGAVGENGWVDWEWTWDVCKRNGSRGRWGRFFGVRWEVSGGFVGARGLTLTIGVI